MTTSKIKELDSLSLRDWWHNILRKHGKYASYAVFIGLPADTELSKYLSNSALELNHISGKNCLIMALSDISFACYQNTDTFWWAATQEHIESGNSLKVAEIFGINFDELPCVVFFRDIRLPEHETVSLKGLSAETMTEKMRGLFTVIQKAVAEKKNPLSAISTQQASQKRTNAISSLGKTAEKFSGQALETLMKTWIEVNVK